MSELKDKKGEGKVAQAIKAYAKTKAGMAVICVVAVVCVLAAFFMGRGTSHSTIDKTQQIGFKDIGELATQVSYTTQIKVVENAQTAWGIKLPFTTTKLIFSYDVETKAGYDFASIEWSVNEEGKAIQVKLPQAKVLSNSLITDSFKAYHEEESIFTPFKLEDTNQSMQEMEGLAQEKAIENGLLTKARENAEVIIRAFFSGVYDLNEYTVEFVDE